jgi:hypothetical protein
MKFLKNMGVLLVVLLFSFCLVVAEDWQELESGTDYDLYDVHMIDSVHGYAVGSGTTSGGIVLYTDDAGDNWDEVYTSSSPFYGVCFSSLDYGFVVGSGSVVVRYDEGEWLLEDTVKAVKDGLNDKSFEVNAKGFKSKVKLALVKVALIFK